MRISESNWALLLAVVSIAVLCVKGEVITFGAMSVGAGPVSIDVVDSKKPGVVVAICAGIIAISIVGLLSGAMSYLRPRYNIGYKLNPDLQKHVASEVERATGKKGNSISMDSFFPRLGARPIPMGKYTHRLGYLTDEICIDVPKSVHKAARNTGLRAAVTAYALLVYVALPFIGILALCVMI